FLDKLRLARLEKAGEGIDRNGHGTASLHAEELRNALLIQLRADDAQPSRDGGGAVAQVDLARHKVKVDPLAVRTGHNALGTEDHAVLAAVQGFQGSAHGGLGEDLGR